MPRFNKKLVCPIGHDCINAPKEPCSNYYYCTNMTYSWDIPYSFQVTDGVTIMVVKDYAWRRKWSLESTYKDMYMKQRQCSIPSGQYLPINTDHEEQEIRKQIVQAWKDEGWKAAIPIPQPKDFDTFFSDNIVSFRSSRTIWIDCFKALGFDEAVKLPYEYDLEEKALIVGYGANEKAKALGWEPAYIAFLRLMRYSSNSE